MNTQVHGVARMKGFVIEKITGMEANSGQVNFIMSDGREFKMYHSQDCCEYVRLIDVIGDPADLIGEVLVEAEEVSGQQNDGPRPADDEEKPEYLDSYTWTFYKLGTRKGSVTLRWLGESNGYYGEGVDFDLKGEGLWA